LAAEGEFALVKEYMERGLQLPGQPVKRGTMAHTHDVYTLLVESAARQRDTAALQKYASLAEELATRDKHKLYLAIAQRASGVAHLLAGEYIETETHFNHALELFRELGTRWQLGRTLAELGEVERARGNTAAARDYFSQALATFEELRASPDVERTRAAMAVLV